VHFFNDLVGKKKKIDNGHNESTTVTNVYVLNWHTKKGKKKKVKVILLQQLKSQRILSRV
jgi:hemerythrin